jgi:hypothetical protein
VGADESLEHRPRRGHKRRESVLDFGEPKTADESLAERMLEGIRQNNAALRAAWARVIKRKEG